MKGQNTDDYLKDFLKATTILYPDRSIYVERCLKYTKDASELFEEFKVVLFYGGDNSEAHCVIGYGDSLPNASLNAAAKLRSALYAANLL